MQEEAPETREEPGRARLGTTLEPLQTRDSFQTQAATPAQEVLDAPNTIQTSSQTQVVAPPSVAESVEPPRVIVSAKPPSVMTASVLGARVALPP